MNPIPADPPLPGRPAPARRFGRGRRPRQREPHGRRRSIQDALRRAIADRRGHVNWTYDEVGWVVCLLSPDREEFRGATLQDSLARCLVWPMVEEFGGGALS